MVVRVVIAPSKLSDQVLSVLGRSTNDISGINIGEVNLEDPDRDIDVITFTTPSADKLIDKLLKELPGQIIPVSFDSVHEELLSNAQLEKTTWQRNQDPVLADVMTPLQNGRFPSIERLEAAIRSQIPSSVSHEELLISIYQAGWVHLKPPIKGAFEPTSAIVDQDAGRLCKPHSAQASDSQPQIKRLLRDIDIRDGQHR